MRDHSLVLSLVWACIEAATLAVDLETRGPFLLPLAAEARLSVLAVHSPRNNVELRLVMPFVNRNVTISLAMAKYDLESQISASGLDDDVAIVSRDKLNLKAQLISVFRKKNVLAVYRAGQFKPVLVYEYKGSKKVDFGKYYMFYSSGPRGAYSVNTTGLEEQGYGEALAQPHGEAVTKELYGIQREIKRRLGIMNAFLNKEKMDKWSPEALKTMDMILDSLVMPHLFLLDYYGMKLTGRYARYRRAVIGERRPAIKARISAK